MKTLKITTHWTAEQADAVYQCLDDLKEAIWQCYGEEIIEMYRQEQVEEKTKDSEFYDDVNF